MVQILKKYELWFEKGTKNGSAADLKPIQLCIKNMLWIFFWNLLLRKKKKHYSHIWKYRFYQILSTHNLIWPCGLWVGYNFLCFLKIWQRIIPFPKRYFLQKFYFCSIIQSPHPYFELLLQWLRDWMVYIIYNKNIYYLFIQSVSKGFDEMNYWRGFVRHRFVEHDVIDFEFLSLFETHNILFSKI